MRVATLTETNSRAWWDEYFSARWTENDGPAQTRYFMEQLLAHLPPNLRAVLSDRSLQIADWGCAFGDGVDCLSATFPKASVTGLDFSERAIDEARRRYPNAQFEQTTGEALPRTFDVVVTSNCLEHFEDPLELVRTHLRQTRDLYIALVPFEEEPLCEYHKARFDHETLPTEIDGFQRILSTTFDSDRRFWPGEQLLVIYASPRFMARSRDPLAAEIDKWDRVYEARPLAPESPTVEAFNELFAKLVSELLPEGGRLLEAGAGAGSQSLALAKNPKYQVRLLDFSTAALEYARKRFQAEGVAAEFEQADVMSPASADFDLVFNAGVLEHYDFQTQVRFIRGMASRSKNLVLVLVPNRLCYWYWIWRVRDASKGLWTYGVESPQVDLRDAMRAAGVRPLGQAYLAPEWTEEFIQNLGEIPADLRKDIIEIHRAGLVPPAQRAYLLAALGTVSDQDPPFSETWNGSVITDETSQAQLAGALADAISLRLSAEREVSEARTRESELRAAHASLRAVSEQLQAQRAHTELRQAELLTQLTREQIEKAAAAQREQTAQQQIAALEQQLRAVEQSRQVAESRFAAARAEFERQIAEANGSQSELEALALRVAELTEESRSLQKQLVARNAELAGARSSESIHALRTIQVQEQFDAYRNQMQNTFNGAAWKVATRIHRLRRFVAPDGSRRHRAVRKVLGGTKSAKHGVRKMLSAVRRRIGLPPAMTWYAYAFDRFKRLRAERFQGDPATIRCAAETGLVSVILPIYNGADMMRESIDSVLAQTYRDFELIIVNDGSKDETPQIADEYAARDPRVRVIHQVNQKLPRALNNGFRAARGEFLTWTSADNRFKPDFLEKMVACLRRHPMWECIYADQDIIGEDGKPLIGTNWFANYQQPPGSEHVYLPKDPSELNTWANNYVGAAFMYRARTPYLVGEYSPRLFGLEDYDYWMRINALLALRHADFDGPVYDYRFHDNSLTSKDKELKITQRRTQMMVFDDCRRNMYLSPVCWCVEGDVDSHGPAVDDWCQRLRRRAGEARHTMVDRARIAKMTLPELWLPLVYVFVADTPEALRTAPPTDLPPQAFKVLLSISGDALPDSVAAGWDLCLAAKPNVEPVRLAEPWRGWLVVPDLEMLLELIDIRCHAAEAERLEERIVNPPATTRELTVIVCAYKRLPYLERCLRSIAEQGDSGVDFEVIVVNNDVEDPQIAALVDRLRREAFAAFPQRLRYLDCPLKGLSHARNAGLSEAKGEFVCFVDDDARVRTGWMRAMRDAFRNDPQAGVIGGKILLLPPTPSPEWLSRDWYAYWSHFEPGCESYTRAQYWWEAPWGANWAGRREALDRIGGFRTHYGRKGDDFGGGEEVIAAQLVKQLGYSVGIEPKSAVTHDVEPSRFTLEHVKKTISSGMRVNYAAQTDLYLGMEATFYGTLRNIAANLAKAARWKLPPGQRTRHLAYARAYWQQFWRQIEDARARRGRRESLK